MTKRWKLKTNSHILLILITLILVKAEWTEGNQNSTWESIDGVENNENENSNGETHTYVGNNEIAEYFFRPSINNNSFILEGINKCLDSFQLITCVKMLLLSRVNDVLSLMEESDDSQKDLHLWNGILIFKIKNETTETGFNEINDNLSLDEEIAFKVKKIFLKRFLLINLLPNIKVKIEPASGQREGDFVSFNCSSMEKDSEPEDGDQNELNEGRKRKGGGMSMMMMVPQLIMLGLMPFTLASLKAMVMNAVMINMMALNGAIFMTIRNLVFGPRQGDNVKYVNYGYSKDKQTQSPKPVLIIHSPAAFVKQPPVYKKQVFGHSSHRSTLLSFPANHYSSAGFSSEYPNTENIKDSEGNYYHAQKDGNLYSTRPYGVQRGNEPGWVSDEDKINDIGHVMVQNNINQRKFKLEVKDRRRNTTSFRRMSEGNSYKTGTNF